MQIKDIKKGDVLLYVYTNSSQKDKSEKKFLPVTVNQVRSHYIIVNDDKHKCKHKFDKNKNLIQIKTQKVGVYQEGQLYFNMEHYYQCFEINHLKKKIKEHLPNDLYILRQINDLLNSSRLNQKQCFYETI